MPYWSCGSGYVELAISRPHARSAYHQGQCDGDVEALSSVPYIAKQLAALKPERVVLTLREYGAWDDTQLADHNENLQRLLWLSCADIVEERDNA
jgi:hypothetical protein